MEKETIAVTVPERLGELAINALRSLELIDYRFEFGRSDIALIIPVKRRPTDAELAELLVGSDEIIVEEVTLLTANEKVRSLHDSIGHELPAELMRLLPRSYDLIGDIAILELDNKLAEYASIIAKGVLRLNPHVRLVVRKVGDVSGEYRVGDFEIVAGDGSTETTYREFSNPMRLDVSSVYFSPRLSSERMRVANQIKEHERVLDMFAGVGPYTILIAKKHPSVTIYSIDINPQAIRYLKENLLLNHVADRVIPYLGDARNVVSEHVKNMATRVIMNLPTEAADFIDVALNALRVDGGILHFYSFASRGEKVENIAESISKIVKENGRRVESVGFSKVLKEISSNRVQVALDLNVE